MRPEKPQHAHWRKNLRLTGALLAIWAFVTFVLVYFARDLDFSFFGWPFSFWVAAQGALVVYGAIVAVYARRMNRIDIECGAQQDDDA